MSFSDSESSSHGGGGEYKTFRQVSRDRLLHEMIRSSKKGDSRTWKVLIMDKVTVKVMSSSCKMADITDEGVSLVEDLFRRRQPLPSLDAIYFIQPSEEKTRVRGRGLAVLVSMRGDVTLMRAPLRSNKFILSVGNLIQGKINVVMFLSDMSERQPLYKQAFVYFSSPISKELVSRIKKDTSVLPRIAALREMNLEFFAVDSQAYITDHGSALENLFGDNAENSHTSDACLNTMAARMATVFASLKEFPFVRYLAAKSIDACTVTTSRDLVPTKLAAAVWNHITAYKSTIHHFPQIETCELLILDRSVDQIAPIIHEWTYDAMCHDVLDLDGNKYVHEVPSKTGAQPERKEVLLEDHDPIWLELRHAHIADASERLHDKMTHFVSQNKAAQLQQRDGGELSTRDLQKMVQALPQYSEQMDRLSLHVEIAGKINRIIREAGLRELGQVEQDIVFGDAGTKEVINFLRSNQDASGENKLRLLMIYASVYPEKFEGDRASKLMQLARLSPEDMIAVKNMRMLEGIDARKTSSTGRSFSLKFDAHKRKHAARKDRTGQEETWQLSRFYPMLEELIERLSKGELPKNEYQCMNEPNPTALGVGRRTQSASAMPIQPPAPHSMRSRRTATWAKPRHSDDGCSSDSILKNVTSDFKKMGQRIFVFIIGGATRSEIRVCHKLTKKLGREVVLGSSSIDDPLQYIKKLKSLSEKELSIDDIEI